MLDRITMDRDGTPTGSHGEPPKAPKRRPLFLATAFGMVVAAVGVVLLAGLLAFLVVLATSGSFAIWGIEWLLRLAGA